MAQIWVVSLKIVFNVSIFKPAFNLYRFLADLRRGSNSFNSDSVPFKKLKNTVLLLLEKKLYVIKV